MKRVEVNPGPCGFVAVIEVHADGKRQAALKVESDCPAVTALAEELETLTLTDIVGKEGFGGVRPFKIAADTLYHATCPVLTGILKAAEAELGLAVPRDVVIRFVPEDEI